MHAADALGGMSALAAATVWGGGDFLGGLATRDRNPFQVLALGSLAGLLVLGIGAVTRNEAWPNESSLLWSAAAGLVGAIGIASLYRGLATAEMARVAPTSAVVSVVLPVAINTFVSGPFAWVQWLGIAIGLTGIWMIHGHPTGRQEQGVFALALLSGLGFGGFFVLIAQVQPGSLFLPLVVSKAVELLFAGFLIALSRSRSAFSMASPLPFVAGVCDAGGNFFYLLASQLTHFGLAAVISSMSPAVTVLLARIISKQQLGNLQKLGVALCLVGIALIVSG